MPNSTTHRLDVRYSLPGPLIQEHARGATLSYECDEATVAIIFPNLPDDFWEPEQETPRLPALSPAQPHFAGTSPIYALNLVRLYVDVSGLGTMNDKASQPFESLRKSIDESWRRASEIA